MTWFAHRNAAGQWCAADRSGTHDPMPDHAAALQEADRRNRDDEETQAHLQADFNAIHNITTESNL